MRYTGLDPSAAYKLRVVYTGDMFQARAAPVAGESTDLHPFLLKPRDMTPLEFDIPREATRAGVSEPDLVRRAGPRRQRPRLPGERGVADQEMRASRRAQPIVALGAHCVGPCAGERDDFPQ